MIAAIAPKAKHSINNIPECFELNNQVIAQPDLDRAAQLVFEPSPILDRAIALGHVALPVADHFLDSQPEELDMEKTAPTAQGTPSLINNSIHFDNEKRAGDDGWIIIHGGQLIPVNSAGGNEGIKQRARSNKEGLSFAVGVGLEGLESLRGTAQTFLSGEHRKFGYAPEDLGTILGITNILLYFRGAAFDCFKFEKAMAGAKSDRHIWGADRGKTIRMAEAEVSQSGAIAQICDLLGKHWESLGVRTRRGTVRRFLQELEDFGFLEYFSDYEPGVRGQSAVFTRLDVPALLALHEQCEALIEEGFEFSVRQESAGLTYELPCSEEGGGRHMPFHRGNSARVLFNALFPGAGYRRDHHDEQPEDWEKSAEVREDAEQRTKSRIAFRFLELDLDFQKAKRSRGESHPRTSWLRRRWLQMLDRYRWLHQTLENYRGEPEAFEPVELEAAASINERWWRLVEAWEDRVGAFVEGLDGQLVAAADFTADCLDYARQHPGLIGSLKFNRVFG